MGFSGKFSTNLIFYSLAVLVTGISTAVLLRFESDYRRNLERRLTEVQSALSSRGVLGSPTESRFSFSVLESEIARYESVPPIGRIAVVKKVARGPGILDNILVHPYYATPYTRWDDDVGWVPRENIDVPQELAIPGDSGLPLRVFPLYDGETLLGHLVLEMNESGLLTLRIVLAGLISLLAVSALLFVRHLSKQEKLISTKTIELDAKRRELVHLERLALAGHLSANLLHDLKKPILNIKNELEDSGLDSEAEGNVQVARSTLAVRMREQIDLFFGMLHDGGFDRFIRAADDKEYVDVNDLLMRSIALVKYERGNITVETQPNLRVPSVFAQPVRIIQVFSNIILNAYQAMGGHGNMQTTSDLLENQVIVRITDDGPGIPEDALGRLFEPFYSTKEPGKGTGLGLYIARDIVEDLGGTLTVDSHPGNTTFTIILPAAD